METTTKQFNHTEAYCVMNYKCNTCGYEEKLWNSRDGVTPFSIRCPKCNSKPSESIYMTHINWQLDMRTSPYFKPRFMRWFIDLTPEAWRKHCEEFVKKLPEISECIGGNYTREEMFELQLKSFQHGQPTIYDPRA